MQVLLATTNNAKIKYYGTKLREEQIEVLNLKDLNIKVEVEETGKSPKENASIYLCT